LDKYAVKAGGGSNHRMGLYDLVMIKDNHISVAGGITNAVEAIRPSIQKNIKIEVETTTLDEVKEAMNSDVDIIMLDNMDNETMKTAVRLINGKAKVEASGNMNLERVKEVASTGVDYISIGALTHSVTALDISLKIKE
jgi:nicotinate-nucleotide pyrophosphorylase (carboxylating)